MARGTAGGFHACGERGHARLVFQRVLRTHQPPDLVEREPPQRLDADVPVALMRRVERPADKADPGHYSPAACAAIS